MNEKLSPAIAREAPDSPDALGLIEKLDAELLLRYPSEDVHGLHPDEAKGRGIVFLVARLDGRAVGCGALRLLEPGAGEVKRMFVLPECRGRGIARRLLAAIEDEARGRDCRALRLETGLRQPEAIALYASEGYHEIPRYGEYADRPMSVCFEKSLSG